MTQLKEEEIKRALSLARFERRQHADAMNEANLVQRSRILTNQRRYQEMLLGPLLENRCRNGAELDKIREQNDAEIRQFLQKQRADAVRHSSRQQDALNYGIGQWHKAMDLLTTRDQRALPILNFVVLDTPLFIFPTQGINLVSTTISPWSSSAKLNGEWNTPYPANGGDGVSFIFVWKNPSDQPVVLNAESYLSLNGFCDVYAEPGANPVTWGENATRFGIAAELAIIEYWNNPPTLPEWQMGQYVNVMGLDADGGGIFGLGDYETSGVSGAYDAIYKMLMVPPKGVVVFEMSLYMGHWTNGGYIEVDFSNGDFQIQCPAVVLALL